MLIRINIVILCVQTVTVNCTIDINVEAFTFIENHLTPQECRRLFAALQFTSYDLSTVLSTAEKSVPQDVPCIKLLLRWNNGTEKWEGKYKSHVDVAHRLRQLGKVDLANWLSTTVFHNLVEDVFDALDNSFTEEYEEISKKKLYEDKCPPESEVWTDLDYFLFFVFIGLVLTAAFILGNILVLKCKKGKREEKIEEEEVDLLSRMSIDSDKDTVYNYRCITTREKHVKPSKEGID